MADTKKREPSSAPERLRLAAMGLEAECSLVVDDEPTRPEDLFGSPRDFIRGELMHRQGTSYHLPTGGAVYFDTRPGSAVVTWDRVPAFGVAGSSNTIQLQLFGNGDFIVAWPSVRNNATSVADAIVGFTQGNGVSDPRPIDVTSVPCEIGDVVTMPEVPTSVSPTIVASGPPLAEPSKSFTPGPVTLL